MQGIKSIQKNIIELLSKINKQPLSLTNSSYCSLKKVLILTILLFLSHSCIIMDTLGTSLGEESVKGTEAKDIIITNAVIGASVNGIQNDIILAFMANKLAGIEDWAYYDKSEVDKCADEALIINLITIDIGGFNCNLQKRKIIQNWPVPII
ncbi:MAG: TIGR04452 family lipoprotein [Spirochaetota bacterium]